MKRKKQLKINYHNKNLFRPELSLWALLWLIVIVPIILFDKFVDVLDLDKNYLICIFMNINENDINPDLLYCHLKRLSEL